MDRTRIRPNHVTLPCRIPQRKTGGQEAVHLIKFHPRSRFDDDKPRLILNQGALRSLLGTCHDLPICVVAIVGGAREGKSEFLNELKDYFEQIEDSDDNSRQQQTSRSFKSMAGPEPVTTGFWAWHRAFKIPTGKKFSRKTDLAVILLDTEGIDMETMGEDEISAILGISLSLSSYIILNSETDSSYFPMDHLRKLVSQQSKTPGKLFQSTSLIVQNWFQNIGETNYGPCDGLKQDSKTTLLTEDVFKNFKNSQYCYFPPSENEDSFQRSMSIYLKSLTKCNLLTPKSLFGESLRADQLEFLFVETVNRFNKFLKLEVTADVNMFGEITSEAIGCFKLDIALKTYDDTMMQRVRKSDRKQNILLWHNQAKSDAEEQFECIHLPEKEEARFKMILLEALREKEDQILAENHEYLLEKFDKLEKESIANLKTKIDKQFPGILVPLDENKISTFYPELELKTELDLIQSQVSQTLHQSFLEDDYEQHATWKNKINQKLETIVNDYRDTNASKIAKVNGIADLIIQSSVRQFEERVEQTIQKQVKVRPEDVNSMHEQALRQGTGALQKIEATPEKFQMDTAKTLTTRLAFARDGCITKISGTSDLFERIIMQTIENYEQKLQELTSSGVITATSLESFHKKSVQAILNQLRGKDEDCLIRHEENIIASLNDVLTKYKSPQLRFGLADDRYSLNLDTQANGRNREDASSKQGMRSPVASVRSNSINTGVTIDKRLENSLDLQTERAIFEAEKDYTRNMDKAIDEKTFYKAEDLNEFHQMSVDFALRKATNLPKNSQDHVRKRMETLFEDYSRMNIMKEVSFGNEIAIGIDLGTTFCCVAAFYRGKTEIIRNSDGKLTTPSYVRVAKNEKDIIVGEIAKKEAYKFPKETIYEAKRLIGRSASEKGLKSTINYWPFNVQKQDDNFLINVAGKNYTPEQISSLILKQLKSDAEAMLGVPVNSAVITVPARFSEPQRRATRRAGELAGLKVLNIINEPSAAALAYKYKGYAAESKKVLVYDLGGGTFDVVVIEIVGTDIRILSTGGDINLGGNNFDKNIMLYCAEKFEEQCSKELFDGKDSSNKFDREDAKAAIARLSPKCEEAKICLSTAETTDVKVDDIRYDEDLFTTVSKQEFLRLNEHSFNKTLKIVDKTLLKAGLSKNDIEDVVLIGGSTRIPALKRLISEHFNKMTLSQKINPDEAVAVGAALQAAYLTNRNATQNDFKLTGVTERTPMAIGVKCENRDIDIIIQQNEELPAKAEIKLPTNGEPSMAIEIYQVDDDNQDNPILLGRFNFGDIPDGDSFAYLSVTVNYSGIVELGVKFDSTESQQIEFSLN